ncbi:4'-phosphopantetheinyl transferase family protein [Glycomyces paridis]|uniref:4'-phosphopantetheinyl transferase superfamily protein n=1 Tax=Glycomyces paridis TaxID=2126555 RepID=A0A4S8P3N2_9ACTN|nr:4'-phosphopantetheinyl transferase superfamily protein [Glycomyces paridis]THV24613.1 4'-phosphopantetheinyl transferase superfamily protein [Glycomyces paridis]
MIELAIARSDLLDGYAFGQFRARVPLDRRRKGDGYHRAEDRYASVVAFSLLQHLWGRRTAEAMPPVVPGAFGKPRFQGGRGHFNLSHDASVCVCVLSPVPVGVDVQSRVPYSEGLFDRMAAPGERRLRGRLVRADDLSALWTRKEAVVKRTGRGLSTPLEDVDTVAAPDVLTLASEDPPFRLSVSAEGLSEADLLPRLRIEWMRPGPAPGTWTTVQRGALRQIPRFLPEPAGA